RRTSRPQSPGSGVPPAPGDGRRRSAERTAERPSRRTRRTGREGGARPRTGGVRRGGRARAASGIRSSELVRGDALPPDGRPARRGRPAGPRSREPAPVPPGAARRGAATARLTATSCKVEGAAASLGGGGSGVAASRQGPPLHETAEAAGGVGPADRRETRLLHRAPQNGEDGSAPTRYAGSCAIPHLPGNQLSS